VSLAALLGLPDDRAGRILALGAHADDIEIGCAGTIARLLAERPALEVAWVVLSASGERADEARRSAQAIVGGTRLEGVSTLRFRDGYLPYDAAAVKEAVLGLRGEAQPDVVLTHRLEDLHQDHRFTAELAWQVFRHCPIVEFEIPKYEGDLGRPNLYVTLPQPTCAAKVEGLLAHFPSQAGHDWFTAETFWALLRLRGVECRSPSGYAEAFTCRKLVA
jgi:LmbE family N-acetylglucosaminyl deacetylase